MNPTLTLSYEASAAVTGRRFVMASEPSTSSRVALATGNTSPIVGVSDAMGAAAGEMCDVHVGGFVDIILGGTVTARQPLTSDANGAAVGVVGASGQTRRIGGYAEAPGVAGDIIRCQVAPGIIQLP